MDIKRRIASTKKTGQITSAMQMVSGAKLSQIEKNSVAYQVYTDKIREIVTHLAASQLIDIARQKSSLQAEPADSTIKKAIKHEVTLSNLLVERPIKKTGYLVITSDRGLVGAYNSSILKSNGPNDFRNASIT